MTLWGGHPTNKTKKPPPWRKKKEKRKTRKNQKKTLERGLYGIRSLSMGSHNDGHNPNDNRIHSLSSSIFVVKHWWRWRSCESLTNDRFVEAWRWWLCLKLDNDDCARSLFDGLIMLWSIMGCTCFTSGESIAVDGEPMEKKGVNKKFLNPYYGWSKANVNWLIFAMFVAFCTSDNIHPSPFEDLDIVWGNHPNPHY